MSTGFVSGLRARPETLRLVAEALPGITVRVQTETWDTIRAVVSADEPVRELKTRALEIFFPLGVQPDEYVLKLHGWEVLDEDATITATGAREGSIFLLTQRRRRPVR